MRPNAQPSHPSHLLFCLAVDPGSWRSHSETLLHILRHSANFLGLPKAPPPYKNASEPTSFTGYNYASAGSGILDATGPIRALKLSMQIQLLNETIREKLSPNMNSKELKQHLVESIFFVWVGSNDYLINYFSQRPSSTLPPQEFAQMLVDELSDKLFRTLYELGARKIVVFEIAPLGCIPLYVDGGTTCDEAKNGNATIFNNKLDSRFQQLRSTYPSAQWTLAKVNALTHHAFTNPSQYGLTNVNSPCCEPLILIGLGKLAQCKKNGNICPNREEYLFWDAAHRSQAAYSILSESCITDRRVCNPSLADLVGANADPISLHSAA